MVCLRRGRMVEGEGQPLRMREDGLQLDRGRARRGAPARASGPASPTHEVTDTHTQSKGTSIDLRPAEIDTREDFGHWEGDCVIGKAERSQVLFVLTERKTRYEKVFLMPSKEARNVTKVFHFLRKEFGDDFTRFFKSITFDNGTEFSDMARLGKRYKVPVYFCHPYRSCERGSNENANRLVRRHFPKGRTMAHVTQRDVGKAEFWINEYPRGIFGFRGSRELYDAEAIRL